MQVHLSNRLLVAFILLSATCLLLTYAKGGGGGAGGGGRGGRGRMGSRRFSSRYRAYSTRSPVSRRRHHLYEVPRSKASANATRPKRWAPDHNAISGRNIFENLSLEKMLMDIQNEFSPGGHGGLNSGSWPGISNILQSSTQAPSSPEQAISGVNTGHTSRDLLSSNQQIPTAQLHPKTESVTHVPSAAAASCETLTIHPFRLFYFDSNNLKTIASSEGHFQSFLKLKITSRMDSNPTVFRCDILKFVQLAMMKCATSDGIYLQGIPLRDECDISTVPYAFRAEIVSV